jgi:phosphinothricin acetyltransferase
VDVAGLSIRAATAVDAGAIAQVYAPHVESSYASFEEVAPDASTMAERMAAQPPLPWLVAEIDGDVVGFAYASHHRVRPAYRWSVDSSVYLDARASGRGVGTALYARLVPILVGLGYVNLFAAIALPNDASVRLHEAQGFVEIGRYRDVVSSSAPGTTSPGSSARCATRPCSPPSRAHGHRTTVCRRPMHRDDRQRVTAVPEMLGPAPAALTARTCTA